MFITRKHLSRRTFLSGAGAAVALPFLEAMIPAQTAIRKTSASPRPRLACIEIVHGSAGSTEHGIQQHLWMPEREGRDFAFTPILQPLEPFREHVTLVTQTDLRPAEAFRPNEEGADHFRSTAVFLTAAHPKQTEGADVMAGTSIDQIIAHNYGQATPIPSIQLCIEDVAASGSCGFNYSCAYSSSISWSSPTSPIPMLLDPRMVFENLFGDGSSPDERARRTRRRRSILDGISGQMADLRSQVAAADRVRLDAYFDSLRDIEREIQAIESYNSSGAPRDLPNAPTGVPDSWEQHVKLMFDLQFLAFAADITRVSTFKMSRDLSNRVFVESGVRVPFHTMSHHGSTPSKIEEFARINTYHVRLLAYFVDRLKATSDGDGTLLDHCLIYYGSPMGDSNVHAHKRVPAILLGHASGRVAGNQHVRCKDETPNANLLLTILNKFDINAERIGDSTGEVTL
jgi:hypothetical protein